MSLTDDEKSQVRHHSGYLEVSAQATFFVGIPAAMQTQFMIEPAMNLLLPTGEAQVRRHLKILNFIEELDVQALEDVEVSEIEGIKIDERFYAKRWRQYQRWQKSLCNILGVISNPFDQRDAIMGGVMVARVH